MKLSSHYIGLILSLFLSSSIFAQLSTTFTGQIVDENDEILIGATIFWQNTTTSATTDIDGFFELERPDTINNHILEIRYVGYEAAVVEIFPTENNLQLVLPNSSTTTETVEVVGEERDNFTSTLSTINVEHLGRNEFKRAACCSLAESFEHNATINVNYSDAVTGAKEIEMLGLRGTYMQVMIEGRPAYNRLGRAHGFEYIPGTWLDNIQISKGASTVRNGIQSITGQINIDLIKPHNEEPLFLNIYGSHAGRFELNAHINHIFSDNLSTGLLIHGNYAQEDIDHNHDGFLDIPKKKQINLLSRWIYQNKDWYIQFNAQGLIDNHTGGQTYETYTGHHGGSSALGNNLNLYEISTDIRRVEVFGKAGFLGLPNPSQSIALIYNANLHEHKAVYGTRSHNALQKEVYANLLFQTALGNPDHYLNSGLTYNLADFEEAFADTDYSRTEQVLSAYTEYSFDKIFDEVKGNAFGLIVGVRADAFLSTQYSNPLVYVSPRLNLKYNFNYDAVIRLSAGRGVRQPSWLIENLRYMPSQRVFELQETINPESAWNYGINYTQNVRLGRLDGNISIDLYRTDFTNQLVIDLDTDANRVLFYNLNGRSYANSFLIAYSQFVAKGLELRFAYKMNDTRTTFGDELALQPFAPVHRGLVALHYEHHKSGWQFNVSTQIVGPQRMPVLEGDLSDLPAYRSQAQSPVYALVNAQITKKFPEAGLEIYIGAENLTNYRQTEPIIGYHDPFQELQGSRAFDAASVYGPVMGTMVYGGIRVTFGQKPEETIEFCSASANIDTDHNDHEGHNHDDHEEHDHDHFNIQIKSPVQCGMCRTTIEETLESVEGIEEIHVDIEDQIIYIDSGANHIDIDIIRQKIVNAGYDADGLPANIKAYEDLPACCKKH